MNIHLPVPSCAALAALIIGDLSAISTPAVAQTAEERMQRGAATVLHLNKGQT